MDGGSTAGDTPLMRRTLVTVRQAAVCACRDERTVRRWISQGLVSEHQTPGGRRVVLQEILHVEAHIRAAPRRRQMDRLASMFEHL